ncbi:site-specific integrase [Phenylobacterium sp.]|jgi:integrase|uniref:tyrosine-type recombinase/integrase n=1 Tax=Phenylobacterium sp. TaxID=1871053 RepID=UPI002F41A302
MAFVTDKEELKPGLVIFRRADVQHRNWYCRVKLPKADRYKTFSLKTSDINAARDRAYDHDADVRFRLKHDVPVFNRPFRDVAKEYLTTQEARAKRGEISPARPKKLKAVLEGALEAYVGSTQVHLIGDELWGSYPAWRRENGAGRNKRNGVREVSASLAEKFAVQDAASRTKAMHSRGIKLSKALAAKAAAPLAERTVAFISDSTIRFEMSIFGAVMNYAVKKRYVPASKRFDERPKLKTMRRDEFTVEEYRKLHTQGRRWIKKDHEGNPNKPVAEWYRTMTYNMILIACNTGMRPSELRNLRWRDITTAKDRDGREIMVLFVQGKGKSRKLVAPKSVGDYLDRIREISKATEPEDRVFTTSTGQPTQSLYKHLIDDLLTRSGLREGPGGTIRSTYSFRHTYATFRLGEGVDVYFLAEQMGTSVKMIEDHYGHVNTIKHADRVLMGIGGWETMHAEMNAESDAEEANAKSAQASKARQSKKPPRSKR